MTFARTILGGLALLSWCANAQVRDRALAPEDALKTFRLEPGLTIELAAAEPLTIAPVALSFDEAGRMFVAENRGYPNDDNPPLGRIALLEDKNGDGEFESRHEYAEGLTYPNGVLAWRGGVIVTCAPDVLYFRDEDGDGRADIRKVLLTGFATNGSTQLRVSHPTLAPDGWVYLSGGLSGGRISSPLQPERAPIDVARQEIRFRPDTGEFEAVDGKGQFGLAFDDFGQRFTCMNRIHIQHVVARAADWRRNPNLAFTDVMQDLPAELDPGLRLGPPAARIFPISQNITTADSHSGTFTAACGLALFKGGALPGHMLGNAFTCDPAANLVHRDTLEVRGASFIARNATEGIEFLASTDDWFSPVNLQLGPDGALYICDMYRRTIEHPDYLPEEVRKKTDFQSGRECGRIYRVSTGEPRARVTLDRADTSGLVEQLGSTNGWVRETAHRLLLEEENHAPDDFADLLADRSTELHAVSGRIKARELMFAAGTLSEKVLLEALYDGHPEARAHAIRIARPCLKTASDDRIERRIARLLLMDESPHVQFAGALALGDLQDRGRIPRLAAEYVRKRSFDRWIRAALLSSVAGVEDDTLRALLNEPVENPDAELLVLAANLAGASKRVPFEILRKHAPVLQLALLNGYCAKLAPEAARRELLPDSARLSHEAKKLLAGKVHEAEQAIAFLRFTRPHELPVLLTPETPLPTQQAAVRALLAMDDGRISFRLFRPAVWSRLSPPVREQLLAGALSRPPLARAVLEQIKNGSFQASNLSPAQRRQLLGSKDPEIRELAAAHVEVDPPEDRQKAFEKYRAALQLRPNSAKGKEIFARACSSCHRLDRQGTEVGPDLYSIRSQPKEAILLHIILPDREIVTGFHQYTIELKDDRILSGIIRSETDTAVTLRTAGGIDEIIPRDAIVEMTSGSVSMMPQELEKEMSLQEMADLLAYLKGE